MVKSDLISREALIQKIFPYGMPDEGNYPINAKAVRRAVEEARPAVVYCKDCVYNVANMEKDPLDATDYTDIVCTLFMTDGMEPHDFCSRGIRK